MEIRAGLELANLTDVGCERENNEDYFCYSEPKSEDEFRRKGRLAVIADGMGGEEGGEIASRLAVEAVRDAYLTESNADPQDCLISGFRAAHDAIQDFVRQRPQLQGMGTTCTAVVVANGHAHFAHIGDSRLYLIRGSSLSQLTHDHTAVNRLIEQGVITPEEADTHPQRHVLTAALGAHREVSADFSPAPIPLQAGDILVLCTDGLWGQITERELLSVVSSNPPSQACKQLAYLAKSRGGPDNLTIQILQLGRTPSQAESGNGNG
jgi:PPM family protein phosphatase